MSFDRPWDKYLTPETGGFEVVIRAHKRDFYVSTRAARACGDAIDKRSVFCHSEIDLLKEASQGKPLPKRLSILLHAVKGILGGEVIGCKVDNLKRSR